MDETEQRDIERRINARLFSDIHELAVAGNASADGLAKRIADHIARNYVISFDGSDTRSSRRVIIDRTSRKMGSKA